MRKYLFIVFSFFVFAYAQAANDKAYVWEIISDLSGSDQATVYLLGSIHFADKSFYPLRKEIEQAFERSDYLVVELDINNIDNSIYNQLIAQKGVYKKGTTIKDVVSEKTWLQLRQRLEQLNIDYENVKKYKPGILVLTLTAVHVMQMGFDPLLGIDAYFLAKAETQESLKPVMELETLEQQLNLFLDIPDAELMLKESLYSMDEAESLLNDMVRFWKQGDESKMNKLLFEDALTEYPAFSAIYDSLFYQRNRQMTMKIDDMLKQNKTYFVVVGSGHLIGEQGIVSALKKKGYEVKRL